MLVVVYHVIELGNWASFPISGPALIFRIGWVGVDLFFVISGFVITVSAVSAWNRDGPAFRRRYFWRRWLRIAPLYFATLLLFLLLIRPEVLLGDVNAALIHTLSHLTFLHNLHPATHGSINGPNWSVALEMQFYLLMALITPWLATRSPLRVLLLFVGIAIGYRFLTTLLLEPGVSSTHAQHVYSSWLPGTLDAFGMGIALALLVLGRERFNPFGLLSASWRSLTFWIVFTTAAFWLSMDIYWAHTYWDQTTMVVLWRTSLALGMVGLVACAVVVPVERLGPFLPLAYLGTVSYGIYLWHTLVLIPLLDFPWLKGPSLLLWTVLGTLVLSIMSWHFFERPFIRKTK